MAKLAPLPLLPSGIYSGYQILTHVAKLVEQEPQRLDMSGILIKFKGKRDSNWDATQNTPACGTVGCIAGWVNIVGHVPNKMMGGTTAEGVLGSREPSRYDSELSMAMAGAILNEPLSKDLDSLFYQDLYTSGLEVGSRLYARYYAKKVRTLRNKHAKFLRTHKVRINRNGFKVVAQ